VDDPERKLLFEQMLEVVLRIAVMKFGSNYHEGGFLSPHLPVA